MINNEYDNSVVVELIKSHLFIPGLFSTKKSKDLNNSNNDK